jgi:molybdopterin converting factor small subunit
MKTITIKLTGAAASLAAVKTAELVLDDAASYAAIIEKLGSMYPGLIGLIIDSDGKTMLSSNMFLVNGQDFVMAGMWNQAPKDGDSLLLISPVTGG